jgi:hypothetical protein
VFDGALALAQQRRERALPAEAADDALSGITALRFHGGILTKFSLDRQWFNPTILEDSYVAYPAPVMRSFWNSKGWFAALTRWAWYVASRWLFPLLMFGLLALYFAYEFG